MDFELNYKRLPSELHRGNKGPHKNRETDLKLKKELQRKLENILTDEFYTEKEVVKILGLKRKQAYKAFRKINKHPDRGMKKEDVIRRLMGGRLYL